MFDVAAWLARNPPHCAGPPVVSQPAALGCWTKASARSGDGSGGRTRLQFGDPSGLLPFVLPSLPASLDSGLYIAKAADEGVGVETVVRSALAAGVDLGAAGLVSFRNNLNKIFGVSFDPSAAWTVDACLLALPGGAAATNRGGSAAYDGDSTAGAPAASSGAAGGTLFLDIVQHEQAWSCNQADLERFVRWGYQFEALCTRQPVADPSSEFGLLIRTRIGPHRLLLGAEMDCYDPQQGQAPTAAPAPAASSQREAPERSAQPPSGQQGLAQQQLPSLSSCVELKTYRMPQHPGQQRTLYRHKHPKWWLQSFLAGVPRLALGARDDEGMVHRVDLVSTADLPRISAAHAEAWSPNLALGCGVALLDWMREQAESQPGQHLRFTYDGSSSSSSSSSRYMAAGGGARGGSRGGSTAGVLRCELVQGGELPSRLQRCFREGSPTA
ncbi:hypothetical protein D9Q98_009241 [Chlorella vulgaris]|uniref:Decapping nuclease n=1 Tax=Chlorella vulgaris TaxID=3077 RepID=A0A9D4TP26_CHLVU|nr:hypothetical protein D9Q98_009241 [Chlorella vulgaris]